MYDDLIESLRYEAAFAYLGSDGERLAGMMRKAADAIEELQKRVPKTSHGRLIDADALITEFCEWGTRLERGRKLVITMSEAKQAIVDIIEDAPTIIPAEEGET